MTLPAASSLSRRARAVRKAETKALNTLNRLVEGALHLYLHDQSSKLFQTRYEQTLRTDMKQLFGRMIAAVLLSRCERAEGSKSAHCAIQKKRQREDDERGMAVTRHDAILAMQPPSTRLTRVPNNSVFAYRQEWKPRVVPNGVSMALWLLQ